MGDKRAVYGSADSGAGKGRYGITASKDFGLIDWTRFALYTLAVVANLVAIFIEPVNGVWVEPFTKAANLLASIASGVAITHLMPTKGQ